MSDLFTGTLINVTGVMLVYNMGRLIALINSAGEVIWRDEGVPMFLVEYVIQPKQAGQNNYKWN